MTMSDGDIRDICNKFFDAYQNSRVTELKEQILAEDCLIWTNVFGLKQRDDNLSGLVASQQRHRRRVYNDRIINTFDGGFVIQYTLNNTEHSGRNSALRVAIVGLCQDGKITRIDEYIDPSKSPVWEESRRPKPEAAQ